MQHLLWKIGELSSLHPKPFSQNKQNEMDRNTNLLFPSSDMKQVELFERETSLFFTTRKWIQYVSFSDYKLRLLCCTHSPKENAITEKLNSTSQRAGKTVSKFVKRVQSKTRVKCSVSENGCVLYYFLQYQ